MPPFFHWYAGVVPPLVGVAVKVTKVPAHTGFCEAVIEIPTGEFCVVDWVNTIRGEIPHELYDHKYRVYKVLQVSPVSAFDNMLPISVADG